MLQCLAHTVPWFACTLNEAPLGETLYLTDNTCISNDETTVHILVKAKKIP